MMKVFMVGLVVTLFTHVAFSGTPPQRKLRAKKQAGPGRDPVLRITGQLEFEGRVVRGSIRKSEIDSLLGLRVKLSGNSSHEYGEYGLGINYEDGTFPAFSCQEWASARTQGLTSSFNTYDRSMESFFINTCGVLYALREAKPAKRSFIANPKVGLSNLNLIPVNVIGPGGSGEEEERLNKLAARGIRVSNMVAQRKVKAKRTTTSLLISDKEGSTSLSEMARADFDGDGIEDIFIFSAEHASTATYRAYDYFLLTRRGSSAGFEVRKLDLKALREPPVDSIPEPAASSSQLELKSSQLKKEEITKQEYGTAWPFTVDAVELACAKAGTVAVFFTAGGITYPLNLWARGSKIDGKVVTSDTRDLTNEHSLVPIFARGFAMCETGSAR